MMIWIDVTDIVEFLKSEPSLSGVQRAELDLVASMQSLQGNIQTCFFDEKDGVFKTIAVERLLSGHKKFFDRKVSDDRLKRRIYKTASSLLPKAIRYKLGFEKRKRMKFDFSTEIKADFRPDDIFILLGAFWQLSNQVDRIQKAVFVNKMKLAVLIYDLIPINHSRWFSPQYVDWWSQQLNILLRRADFIFTISQFIAGEVREYAAKTQIEIKPVKALRLGTPMFARNADATRLQKNDDIASLQYRGSNFVLTVSTIDERKNQKFLLPIWCRLMKELGPSATPDLLLIGKDGTQDGNFLTQIRDNPELKGKVVVLNRVGDRELARYYQRTLFTVFPSLAEGWGFPVAESLSFGKACVASNVDSIPEVGGSLVSYFPPNDLNSAYDLVRNLIANPSDRARIESMISNEFKPTEWSIAANSMLAAFGSTE